MLGSLHGFFFSAVLFGPATTATGAFRSSHNATIQPKLLHQYEPITWVENIAVRPNGPVLPITATSAILNQLDPVTGDLAFVHDFSSAGNAIQGITEIHPDYFALNVLTCNITGDLTCTPGSLSTWTVDFGFERHHHDELADPPVHVRKVTTFPDAGFLNGIAALEPGSDLILMADSFKGGIWSLDISTGEKALLFTEAAMAGTDTVPNGINGIRVRHDTLYFTNSALGAFNRVSIDPSTGAKRGNVTVIAEGLAAPDDLEIEEEMGVAYVCNGFFNQVLRIRIDSGESNVVTEVPGPTSVRWARSSRRGGGKGSKRLIVSTIGGLQQYVQGNVTVGGAAWEIEV